MRKRAIALLAATMLLSACNRMPDPTIPVTESGNQNGTETIETSLSASLPTETTIPVTEIPTMEPTVPLPADDAFVRIADYIPNLRTELAYATEDNFTDTVIYEFTDAYLRYGSVRKLAEACEILAQKGYGILIWDAYRPVYAQERLWEICPDPTYVSKPGTGSQSHCRGIAVDVTLYDLETGEVLEMPTGFDHFSALADRDYSDCSSEAAVNAVLLEKVMEECGFKPYNAEWWHFTDTQSYEIEYTFDPAQMNEF